MQSLINEPVVRRGRRVAKWFGLSGLGVLLVGLVLSFNPPYIQWSFVGLIVGFALSQIGIYNANKYLKRPRSDEALDAGLKGMGRNFRFYHYYFPAEHVLLSPFGLQVFRPKASDGRVTYDGRWRQNFSLLRIFQGLARERLGNPAAEVEREVHSLARLLETEGIPPEEVPVAGFIVFTHPQLRLEIQEEPPYPVYPVRKFKDAVRRWFKEQKAIPTATRRAVQEALDRRAGLATQAQRADEGS